MPEDIKYTPTCGYCGNIITGKVANGCQICKGKNLCDDCHLPKDTCGCRSDGLKYIQIDGKKVWDEKEGPLNPDNYPDILSGEKSHPLQMLDELHEMARDIINKKNHDYRGAMEDDYANFRGSKALGIHPGHGVLLRIQDKMMRVKTFIDKGELHVKGESIDDALVDITNYCALLRGIIQTDGKY